jgi:outer membrane receptor protein involved in Fe transport
MAFSSLSYGQALEEIVVTASKRGEVSLQDMTGNIQAISSDTLEKAHVEGFEDYIKMVPGLTSVSSGTGQSQIVIRGVNANRVIHSSAQANSLAGMYLDEMPISLTGFNPDLGVVDVERVEVLRGPQGTLYGASSMSGTIRVITKQPDTEELSGRLSADTSWTKDGDMSHGLKGAINIPLNDQWAARASAYYMDKGGYIDNVSLLNPEEDYNDEETIGGRIQLGYYGDKLDATATVMYNKLEADGRPDEYRRQAGDNAVITTALAPITGRLQTVKDLSNIFGHEDKFENEFLSGNLTLNYDFENVNLASTTSYFDTSVSNSLDDSIRVNSVLTFLGGGIINGFFNESDYDSIVQEIRLSSTNDSPLQWILGGYYEDNSRAFAQTAPAFNAAGVGLNVILGAPPTAPLAGASPNSVFDGLEALDTTQLAVFGEATYSFTDALRLTLGFRYFDYERDVTIDASGPANGGPSFDQGTIKEDDFIPKVEIAFDINEDMMAYATYSEGFRLGGVNGFIPTMTAISCQDQLNSLGLGTAAQYGSDTIENIEFGIKSSWLENRLTANVTVYRNEFSDIIQVFGLDCGFFQTVNSGTLQNTGVEGEFAFQMTDELSTRFGFAYVDSEIDSGALPGLNVEGDSGPYVPDFSASGSIEYGKEIFNGFGFIRADIRHVGEMFNEFPSNPAVIVLPSYTSVDVTARYDINNWEFSVFAKNLTNDEIVTNIDPDRVQPLQYTRGRPRTIGLSVTKNF